MKVLEKIVLKYNDGTQKEVKKEGFVAFISGNDMDAEFIDGMESEDVKMMLEALLTSIKVSEMEYEKLRKQSTTNFN